MEGCANLQTSVNKRTTNIVLFLGIIMLFSFVSLAVANTAFTVTDNIYDGVFIGDTPVGGLSIEEAKLKIEKIYITKLTSNPPITIRYKEQSWNILSKDINLSIDTDALALEAYNVGRTGNLFTKLQNRYLAVNHGFTIPLKMKYDEQKLNICLTNIAQIINQNAKNAIIHYNNSSIKVETEAIGYKVNLEKTTQDLLTKLNNSIPITIELTVDELFPSIITKDLTDIDGLLAVYTTQFDQYNKNRSQNISLAVKNINNVLLRPNQIFSFNQNVGLRLEKYGYKEAPVFIDGKLVLDWGGGVCQVSSTLYNAALLADMSIEERTSHYRPAPYVPLGQDAAVADNLLDFKFKNTSSHNIYIISEVSGNQLSVYILGKTNTNNPEIKIITTDKKVIEPNVIVKQDPLLDLGKEIVEAEGQKGYQVSTYRIKLLNNKEINREYISSDDFKVEDKIIRVGTKLPPHQPTK